jgi:hypothetical protein
VDFVEALERQLDVCDAMVALIGSRWLNESDETDGRRLDNPSDWVRMELEAAFARGVRIIPVLVDGAAMPRESELPDSLKLLARRQGGPPEKKKRRKALTD